MKEMNSRNEKIWSIPYCDFSPGFWENLSERFGNDINEVYFPIRLAGVGSGRPEQPSRFLDTFLDMRLFPLSVLINPIILKEPAESIAPGILKELQRLCGSCRINSVTVTDMHLAGKIRESFPGLKINASILADIYSPLQIRMLDDVCDVIVASSRIMRNIPSLKALKASFSGKIRLIVNEGCIPGCPFRIQHFYEMSGVCVYPESLCVQFLEKNPWLRLTGSWVLPQHLHLFDGIYDELKLGGRAVLNSPESYVEVLSAYINTAELPPDRIGGGPAAFHQPFRITEAFYKQTLYCSRLCHVCTFCRDYYKAMKRK